MLRTGQFATLSRGCRHSASTAGSRPTPGVSYQGPWRLPGPDSHRLAAVSLSLGYVMFLLSVGIKAPELLDAHGMKKRCAASCVTGLGDACQGRRVGEDCDGRLGCEPP